ncbi:competence protein ComK [Bacillus songklensis]|uniref:Competence protein ComK n=1 Tax=Bacillus songklensis TaxID=1069116 RepID=A0ABV8AZF4_9BACI
MKLNEKYRISATTMAITAYAHPSYQTKIFDFFGGYYTSMQPLELIEEACIRSGSTYEGRRKSIVYLFHYEKRTPIPISPLHNIFAFPTTSTNHFHCTWLFLHHILQIVPHPTKTNQSIVTFRNNAQLIVHATPEFLKSQRQKTAACMTIFQFPIPPRDDQALFLS